MHNTFTTIIEIIGTFAFAVSGIRLASQKQFDWFGAYVVGLITAIGGGTIRDLLINKTAFWMTDYSYLLVTGIALLSIIFYGKFINKISNALFLFDSVGLGLFVVVGIQKTIEAGFPFWVAVIMGTITGSVGGIIRDIFINEVPLIFRKDIYALACVIGGLVFGGCELLGIDNTLSQLFCGIAVITTRILALKYHLSLPVLTSDEDNVE